MSQDQRLRQVASALREKASQFDVNKEKSKKQIKSCISTLRDLINIVEADLLRKVDSIFGHNLFAVALAEVEGYNGNGFIDYNKLEKASKEPVPPVTGPSQEAFSEAKKAVLELCDFERRAVPLRVSGRATSFDSIELSWSSVPSAVTYQVESRRPSDSAFSKIYEGNNLSYTVAGLGPETRYLFHLRSVFGDGSVSEWSEVIKIATQEVPVLCNVTANALSWNTVSVSWSPVPAEGVSYRVCVMENARNDARSCVVDCGQNTWYRPSGLQPSTKYSFCVQAGRGNAWGKWSSTVSMETPKWRCAWKECPDNVECKRKYSVDEKNPRIVTFTDGSMLFSGYCTIIGNTLLPHNKVTSWNIRILKSKDNDGGGIWIGVAPSDIDQNERDNNEKCGWYFCCYNSKLRSGPPHNYSGKECGPRKDYGQYIHTGDSVGVVMDTTNGELSFVVDGVNLGVAYKGIPLDKPLVPCVLFGNGGDSVEFII